MKASSSIGPATGNAIAYFGIWWLNKKYGYVFEDSELAIAMGGALVATVLLELRKLGRGVVFVFDRIFPPKTGDK